MPDSEQNYSIATTEYSRVIPVWKFALFSIASFGFYELYWNYKSWKFFKERNKLDISPFWRTFFMPIFIWSLFDKYSDMVKEEGYQIGFPVPLLAVFWIGMNFVGRLESSIWLISFLSFLAFVPVLDTVNIYWKKQFPGLPEKSLTWWQIVLLIIGTIFFFLGIVGTLITE